MDLKIFADLHNHTTASDGDLTALQLILAAREKGIRAVGVTDHDTLAGLTDALAQGRALGVEVLPGVEVSVRFARPFFTGTLHILTYFDPGQLKDPGFVSRFEALLSQGRGEALVRARVARINAEFGPQGRQPVLGRAMTFEDIRAYAANASRRHFALALEERFHIRSRDQITAIIGNASPAYLPSGVDLADAAAFLAREPVVGVLAHPAAGSFSGPGHYREVLPPLDIVETLLPELLAAGVAGLEVYYPGHDPAHQERLLELARTHGLLVTGGSDCHDISTRPPGVAGITQDDYLKLKDAIHEKS